jgi:hypothetical protein
VKKLKTCWKLPVKHRAHCLELDICCQIPMFKLYELESKLSNSSFLSWSPNSIAQLKQIQGFCNFQPTLCLPICHPASQMKSYTTWTWSSSTATWLCQYGCVCIIIHNKYIHTHIGGDVILMTCTAYSWIPITYTWKACMCHVLGMYLVLHVTVSNILKHHDYMLTTCTFKASWSSWWCHWLHVLGMFCPWFYDVICTHGPQTFKFFHQRKKYLNANYTPMTWSFGMQLLVHVNYMHSQACKLNLECIWYVNLNIVQIHTLAFPVECN